jgi:hypothetical protein
MVSLSEITAGGEHKNQQVLRCFRSWILEMPEVQKVASWDQDTIDIPLNPSVYNWGRGRRRMV